MTSNEWKKCKLGDIADVTKLAGFEFTKYINYDESGEIIALRALNLRNGTLDLSDIKRIKKSVSDSLTRSKLYINDILLTYTGNGYGDCAIIKENDKYHLAPNICKISPKIKIVDPYYLYSYIRSKQFYTQMKNNMVGSGQPTIPMKTIRILEIPICSKNKQQKIAKVLSAIDDKIELNNSINNNLEQQAQAIFKENISKNCNNSRNGCIGDYCAVKSGFAFKGSWWQNTGIKVIKIKTIDNDNINFNDCSYVSEDKIQYAKDFIVKGGDLLIAMTGATIGKFAIVPKVNETILVNQRVGKFFLGENPVQNLPFLYCTLKEHDVINEIINKGQGSAQPNISGSDIMNTLCYLPEKQNIVNFNNLCTPIFEKIINNKYENYHLIKLRDTLLPKLMSGEIDVSKVEIDDILENPSEQSSSTDKLL